MPDEAARPPARRACSVCDGILRLDAGPDVFGPDGGPVTIELAATAHRFAPGHRIRVQVSGGAHPCFARNTGTREPVATATRLDLDTGDGPFDATTSVTVVDHSAPAVTVSAGGVTAGVGSGGGTVSLSHSGSLSVQVTTSDPQSPVTYVEVWATYEWSCSNGTTGRNYQPMFGKPTGTGTTSVSVTLTPSSDLTCPGGWSFTSGFYDINARATSSGGTSAYTTNTKANVTPRQGRTGPMNVRARIPQSLAGARSRRLGFVVGRLSGLVNVRSADRWWSRTST